jgi:5-methylcytosine-specific restriction endonuclease McrA
MHDELPVLGINDQLDRHALWDAHNRRCRYCDEPLLYTHLEIDHIIPKNLRSDPDALATCLRQLGLPDDYNFDRIDNLLPVHSKCNREKSGTLHVQSTLLHLRDLAARAARNFSKLRAKISQQASAAPDLAKMAKHISAGATTLEEVADVATNRKPFNPTEDIQKIDFIRLSEPRVRVECKLPTVGNPSGSATVTFHSLQLRGAQIEVDHQTLVRELFRDLHAPSDSHWRRFLEAPRESAANYHLRVGPVSVQLDSEEAAQFCRLLDRLYPVYARAFKDAETAFAGLSSPLKTPGVYEIASIPLAVWQQMEAFVRLHDLAKGSSEWHIFDAPAWVWLKIIRRTREHWDYQCFMDVIVGRPGADPRCLPHSPISLRWVSSKNLQSETEQCWSVAECADFMSERLIPKVLSANWLGKPIVSSGPEHMHAHHGAGYKEISAADFISPTKAASVFEEMQSLYLEEHDQFIIWDVIATTFQFLCRLLEHHQLPSYALDYISIKLWCGMSQGHSQLLAHVRAILARTAPDNWVKANAITSGTVVDHALRCVLEVLRNGDPDPAVPGFWLSWISELKLLIDDYNDRSYLVRMRAEDFEED